ncbi:BASS family bile acid:Na+ symporter [Methylohalomonas lacus]|uniref:BASS family bile acid:Na+ symporter n=1 Tax=Methylohalomonas lacus TaxID=398773 RepID=A0AAE3L183_9GAMM|nr:bile acid:sodium symporter family protein [Methylohalomonas lacus]MCS3903609.1 BASS family bile acid:Na+ symporter [Methylohalomonas lacus]
MEANILTAVFLPLALVIIMLGMGLSLTPAHFRAIFVAPRPILVGLALQLVALPSLAWLLAWALQMPPALAVGLVLIAACPGGATSNLISHLARADAALSITLTALSSLVIIFSLPFVVNAASLFFMEAGQNVSLSVPKTILQIVVVTVIPVSIGMWLRSKSPERADRAERSVKVLSALFLALVIAGILVGERDNLLRFFMLVGVATLLLNLGSMLLGYVGGRLARLPVAQVRTVVIEVGIQNGTMAIAVATAPTLLNNSSMAIPAAIYSLIMFVSGAVLIAMGNRNTWTVAETP